MRRSLLTAAFFIAALPTLGLAQEEEVGIQPEYDLVNTAKVGGNGGWEKMTADADARRLYIPRSGAGAAGRIMVLDLDTMRAVGTVPGVNAKAVAINSKTGQGFAASKPVAVWDTKTNRVLKTITVQGEPENILFDAFNDRVYVFNQTGPNVTIIDAVNGSVTGTLDLGGTPGQGVADGLGKVFVGIKGKDEIAVIDARTATVTARYDLDGIGADPVAMTMDLKNRLLLIACRNQTLVYMNADTGKFIYGLPIGAYVDGVVFNPATNELFSAQADGTLTIAAVTGPTSFAMKGTIPTAPGSKTLAIDTKTGKILVATAEFSKELPEPEDGDFYGIPDLGAPVADTFTILSFNKKPAQ